MKEFKIVVVASRHSPDRPTYEKLLPSFIRLIDLLHNEDKDVTAFKVIHNGVTVGPLKDVFWVLDNIQPSMKSFGKYVQRQKVKMDVLMDGADAERKWLDEQIKDADALFVVDYQLKRPVKAIVNDSDLIKVEVKI